MPSESQETIASLGSSLDAMHRRMNGLLTAMFTVTRVLTAKQAERAGELLQEAAEHLAADAVASSMPDAVIDEQARDRRIIGTLKDTANPTREAVRQPRTLHNTIFKEIRSEGSSCSHGQ